MKSTRRAVGALALLGALAGCSGEAEREAAVRKALEAAQFEQIKIEFRDLRYYPGDVACGTYSAVDKWGKEVSSREFIVRDGTADTRARAEDRQVFCTEDPAAGLQAATGIDWGDSRVAKIYRDLRSLQQALDAYAGDNSRMPTTRQGLAALVSAPVLSPQPMKYRDGGYLASLPKDPWGRDYLYRPSTFGGVADNPEIKTLGADGAEGGSGENADISTRQLKYLDHLARL